jgi:hypothetical protein
MNAIEGHDRLDNGASRTYLRKSMSALDRTYGDLWIQPMIGHLRCQDGGWFAVWSTNFAHTVHTHTFLSRW